MSADIQVVSMNTDGILIKVPPEREADAEAIIKEWEAVTGFEMERKRLTKYRRLNVNSYIAIDEKGEVKAKGLLNYDPGLDGDPDFNIVGEAIAAYMRDGADPRATIMAAAKERNLAKFAKVVTTNGPGFRQGAETYGKVVRVYRAKGDVEPIRVSAHGKVGEKTESSGCRVFRSLSEWPEDIDLEAYVSAAHTILEETRVVINPATTRVARQIAAAGFVVVGIGGSKGVTSTKVGADFSGSAALGVKVAPAKDLIYVPAGVEKAETLPRDSIAITVSHDGDVIGAIHRISMIDKKLLSAIRKADAVIKTGDVPVYGEGRTFEMGLSQVVTTPSAAPEISEQAEAPVVTSEVTTADGALLDNDGFLRAIFGDKWQDAYVVSMADPPDGENSNWSGGPAKFARGKYLNENFNNFVSVSTFRPEEGGGYRRRAESFEALHCLFLDDIGTKAVDPATAGFGPPTLRLETSAGNFTHIYALSAPVTDPAFAELFINAAVKGPSQISDKGVGSITRVFRLPFGTNNKKKYPQPFAHRVAEWRPEVKYSAEEILGWLKQDVEAMKAAAASRPASARGESGERAMSHPVVAAFEAEGRLVGAAPRRDGWIGVECPWSGDHEKGRERDGAAVQIREDGTWRYNCKHGHCNGTIVITRNGEDREVAARGTWAAHEWLVAQGHNVPHYAKKVWENPFDKAAIKERAESIAASAPVREEAVTADEEAPVTEEPEEDLGAGFAEQISKLEAAPGDKAAFNEAVRLAARMGIFDRELARKELRRVTKFRLGAISSALEDARRTKGREDADRKTAARKVAASEDDDGEDSDASDDDLTHSAMASRYIAAKTKRGAAPVTDEGTTYEYGEDGIWQPVRGEQIRNDVSVRFATEKRCARQSDYNGIQGAVIDQSSRPGFFREGASGVCCPDGFWKLDGDQVTLLPHDHRNRSRFRVPFNPDFSGEPETFLRVLREGLSAVVTGDVEDASAEEDAAMVAEQIRLLQQLFGATIMGLMTREQRAVFLMGAAASFKSGTLRILESFFDPSAKASVAPKDWDSDTNRGAIAGKRLNTVGESNADEPLPTAVFKAVIGGDTLTGRHLYGRPFEFKNTAAMWFAGNHFFKTRDNDRGFWRRWAIIRFKTPAPENRRDPKLVERIIREEGGKIFAWAMAGAVDLEINGLALSRDHAFESTDWVETSSTVAGWLADVENGTVTGVSMRKPGSKPLDAQAAYRSFQSWCANSGREAYSRQKFYSEMKEKGHEARRSNSGRWIRTLC